MEDKRWILGLVIVVAAIAAMSFWGFKNNNVPADKKVAGQSTEKAEYFSEDASVMMFYSEKCSWCLKEKEELAKISKDGYRVKPMDVGSDPSLWEKYEIKGTPTFIAKNGDRSEGYKPADELKKWLDEHK